jgi:putative CocE/NonD family hydrolase
VSPFSTSRTGAVELGPSATGGVGLSTPLVLDWMDRWLLGRDAGAGGGVRYWQHGANEWRETDRWPPAHVATRWYLRAGRELRPEAPDDEAPDAFRYDPLDPVPTVGGKTLMPTIASAGIEDQDALAGRDDVLVYETAPITEPVELHGPIRVELWASSSAVDTDFTAKLVDVAPDGFAANLADGIVRARYRESPRSRAAPLEPGAPTRFAIDLWDLAHTFLAGHRIRVEISSSNFPRFDRNTNTGHEPGVDGPADVLVADQRVFHDTARPSALVLPVAD